jgi:hypothetical protein
LRGGNAETANDFRPDAIELPEQERRTRRDLIVFWEAVSWGATLHDIADINFLSLQLNGFYNFGQELTRSPDKRKPLDIFVGPGSLANKNQLRVRRPRSENDIGARRTQLAALAVAQVGTNFFETLSRGQG